MDHPNIAKVLDAGTTDSGRPFFVMELIRGIPIVDYCDSQGLTTTERLKLFVDVCRAVQHAHAKGVIHRDLKPSNILVSPHDGIPVVKVIDFGIAKAMGQQLTDKTIHTRLNQMVGTLLYMSPEQAEINALDVDIRSDVYSLGVLLYELLTGTTPFDRERFSRAAYDEIKRIIREEEPPTPSKRLEMEFGDTVIIEYAAAPIFGFTADAHEAVEKFNRLKVDPENPNAILCKATFLAQRDGPSQLLELHERIKAKNQDNVQARYHGLAILALCGRKDLMQQEVAEILTLPNQASLSMWGMRESMLVVTGALTEDDIAKADKIFTRCSAFHTLGLLALADGRKAESKQLFRACLDTGVHTFFEYHWSKAYLDKKVGWH